MKLPKTQKGIAHILLLVAALGLIIFLLFSSSAPFKDKLFSVLFPKPSSRAATSTDTTYDMGVLVIKYFPLTADGQNIDISVTGDVGDLYTTIKQRTVDVTTALKNSIEKATSYLGFRDPSALPSLKYNIVDTKEYTQLVPFDSTTRRPLYKQIMTDHDICDYVDNKGVREVWLWAYQGPATFPNPNDLNNKLPYLNIYESTMAGPSGFYANGGNENMPICQHTYRVYTFNYSRFTSEAIESWGHQMEAEMYAVDRSFFIDRFQGPNYPQTLGVNGRCGSVHNPPNARSEYDRNNPTSQKSDCLDWNPDSLGTLSDISCGNWGCADTDKINNNSSLNYQIWNWQNLQGRGNTKTYQSKPLRNFWDIHGDFDKVMSTDKTLFLPNSTPVPTASPTPRPSTSPTPTPSPTPRASSTPTPKASATPTPKPSVTPLSATTPVSKNENVNNQISNNSTPKSAFSVISSRQNTNKLNYASPTPSASPNTINEESENCGPICTIGKLLGGINKVIEKGIEGILVKLKLLPPQENRF